MSGTPLPVAVVDYGAGNLVSIEQALTHVGAQPWRARRAAELANAAALIVPGVGAAGSAMARLRRSGLVDPIRDWIAADRPFLGICLGLQLLFDSSDEDGARTLGILPGVSRRLVDAPTLPHIGWNQVRRRRSHPLFDGLSDDADLYFVHSYVGAPTAAASDAILAETEHGRLFVSAVARSNLLGVQFHPERSGADGLRVLSNFVRLAATANARAA
ncbi:MAG TPA: imidazole glycerol phosphate synthase subunit HisH [Candidatus Polarisedimenticolia bacterium]|nr:imidazole glycerol phosphate synthase subunit HisH [Candidatus Polarisedimenticolia bacterium]